MIQNSGFITKILLLSLLLVLPLSLSAQTDTTKTKVPHALIHLDVELDYGKLLGQFVDFETKYEGAVALGYKERLRAVFEYGQGTYNPVVAIKNGSYEAEGTWMRYGLDYFVPVNSSNWFGMGLRFANSDFKDSGSITINSDLFTSRTETFLREGLTASWIEIVLHTKTEVIKGLYVGGHVRIRSIQNFTQESPIEIFNIPGFGRTFDTSVPAVNLYVMYRLGFGKTQ